MIRAVFNESPFILHTSQRQVFKAPHENTRGRIRCKAEREWFDSLTWIHEDNVTQNMTSLSTYHMPVDDRSPKGHEAIKTLPLFPRSELYSYVVLAEYSEII